MISGTVSKLKIGGVKKAGCRRTNGLHWWGIIGLKVIHVDLCGIQISNRDKRSLVTDALFWIKYLNGNLILKI